MSVPTTKHCAESLDRISSDSADAARWRLFCHLTEWNGGAHEAAQRYNDMTAQLAQYETALDKVLKGAA